MGHAEVAEFMSWWPCHKNEDLTVKFELQRVSATISEEIELSPHQPHALVDTYARRKENP